MKKSGHFRCR